MAEKNYFDEAVEKLSKELEGKNLRKEWSINRMKLKKAHGLSTQQLHRAFQIIGRKQKLGDSAPVEMKRPTPKNKAEWQELYQETFGAEPEGLTVAVMKDAIKNNEVVALSKDDEEGGLPPVPPVDPPGQ